MPEVAVLREDLGKVIARLNAISEQYKVGGIPAEKKAERETLVRKGKEIKTQIAEELKAQKTQTDIKDLDDFLNKPENTVPHGIEGGNGDGEGSDERKMLARAGWEFKSGAVWRHT